MFFPKRDPDEPEPVGPDDEREWRSEADLIRRTNAELERVKRAMTTYRLTEKLWLEILDSLTAESRRQKYVDDHPSGKIIEP